MVRADDHLMVLSLRTLRCASLRWDARIFSLHVSRWADARRCVSAGENMGFASQNRHFHNAKQAFLEREKGVVEEGIDRLWRFRREEGDSQHS